MRRQANLSQFAVARHLGITEQYYQRIESGRQNPSKKLAEKIADLFSVDARLFFVPSDQIN